MTAMTNDEKLRIALEALLELTELDADSYDLSYAVDRIATGALREIQREHYLGDPSSVVADAVGARRL